MSMPIRWHPPRSPRRNPGTVHLQRSAPLLTVGAEPAPFPLPFQEYPQNENPDLFSDAPGGPARGQTFEKFDKQV